MRMVLVGGLATTTKPIAPTRTKCWSLNRGQPVSRLPSALFSYLVRPRNVLGSRLPI
jgi:hypothetical protein